MSWISYHGISKRSQGNEELLSLLSYSAADGVAVGTSLCCSFCTLLTAYGLGTGGGFLEEGRGNDNGGGGGAPFSSNVAHPS